MDKNQYQCIKAVYNEVEAFQRDGYQIVNQCTIVGGWWMRFLKHPNGKSILVEMNATRTEYSVWISGKMKKCKKFGA